MTIKPFREDANMTRQKSSTAVPDSTTGQVNPPGQTTVPRRAKPVNRNPFAPLTYTAKAASPRNGTESGAKTEHAVTTATKADDTDDTEDEAVDAVPGRYVAEDLCRGLDMSVKRALSSVKPYISIDHLLELNLVSGRPTLEAVDHWCHRTTNKGFDLSATVMSRDELRAIVAVGPDHTRKVALATLQDTASEGAAWALAAVEKLRARNTVARSNRWRKLDLTLTVGDLIALGATREDVATLPTASESSLAASVKITEAWNAADQQEARKPKPDRVTMTLTRASEVEAKHIDWLWSTEHKDPLSTDVCAAMIPLHGLTLVAGREMSGKSTFCGYLTAQITRGTLPGHYEGTPRDVVMFATEEAQTKIVARLDAAGADMDRVHFPKLYSGDPADDIEVTFSIRDHLHELEAQLAQVEPALVIFDPLKDFLGDGVNTDREDEVRPVLKDLLGLTEEFGAAVVGLHHLNKDSKTGDFLHRLTGSGAFKNVARAVIGVVHVPDTDIRLVELKKSNDAEMGRGTFQAKVIGKEVTIDGRTEKVGVWEMDGRSALDLDTALAEKERGAGRAGTALERAKDALENYFGEGGAANKKDSEDVKKAITEKEGVSMKTVQRAFKDLGGKHSRTTEKPSRTLWWLPSDDGDQDAD